MTYALTPADIMELRASTRWNPSVSPIGLAFICLAKADRAVQGAEEGAYTIHTQGQLRAISKRIEVLAECLRQEWARPGFMVDILDSRIDCTEALLDPASLQALRSRQAWEAKAAREFAAAEQARERAAKRSTPRTPAVDISTISPDDIFDD